MPSKEFISRKGSVWERYDLPNHPIEEARADMDQMAIDSVKPYSDVIWEPGECAGLPGKWVRPNKPTGDIIYYIHGGGFTHGSSGIPLPFLMELAHRLRVTCFSVDYRMAPECPFPAAPDDAFKAYKGILEMGYPADRIVVCGESAGATLSLDIPLMAKEAGIPVPKAVVALSPVTDGVGVVNDTVLEGLNDPNAVFDVYAPGVDKHHPLLSPFYGDLNGFPPVFLSVGSTEPLLRDSLVFAEKAANNHVDVRLHVGREMIHTYPLDLWDYPEAMTAFEEIELFIRQMLH